jgi:hypothetical protein
VSCLMRARAARDWLMEIVRREGRRAGGGWVSATEGEFHIMHRTPVTAPMPKGRQSRTYSGALLSQHAKPDLPYTMEVWYSRKRS